MHHIPPTGRKEELHNYWVGLIFALEEEEEEEETPECCPLVASPPI